MLRVRIHTLLIGWILCTIPAVGWAAGVADPAAAAPSPAPTASPAPATPQSFYALPPVVVTATRASISPQQATNYVTELTEQQIEQSPQLVLDDLLRQVSGFNTFRRSSSMVTAPADDPEAQGVTLRGVGPGGASRALVLLDGIPVNDAFGGWIYWDEIPLNSIERIEVVEGGGSNLWGNEAEGGVINIISRRPENSAVTPQASYGIRNTTQDALAVDYVKGAFRTSLEGNFFNTNGWNIVESGFRGPLDQNSSSIHELFAGRVEFDPGTGLQTFLRGSYYNENLDLGTPFRSASATRGFINGGGTLQTDAGDLFRLSAYGHLSDYDQNFSIENAARTAETPSQTQHVPSTDAGAFLTWTRTFFKYHQVTAGGDFRLIDGSSHDDFFNTAGAFVAQRQVSSGRQNFFGAFIEDVFRPTENLEIDGSVRGDFFDSFDGEIQTTPAVGVPTDVTFPAHMRTATSPRLGVRYNPWQWLTLRAGLYEAFRVPTLAELYRQSSVEDLVLLPNPNLSPEFLEGGEIGFQCSKWEGLTFGVTGYWDKLFDPISNVVTAANPVTGDDAERTRVNLGRARIRGYEIDAQYTLPYVLFTAPDYHDSLSITGSFLESEATLTSNPPDPTLTGRRLALVPWQTFNLGVHYSTPIFGDLVVQEQYFGKQYEDSDNHDLQSAYWLTNLTLSKTFTQPRYAQWLNGATIFAKVQNVMNRAYIIDLGGGIPKVGTPLLIQFGLSAPIAF
ncbi:MAG TPA: TonB-dependent receptor [Candidatus Binataceae bacterium]|nr:TonB-dependent receptor [Candidatus Binataceae bacterium]